MGFISKENNGVELIAKLTPYGRQQILGDKDVVKYFSLGDSDANYQTSLSLLNGEIPTMGGNIESIGAMCDCYEIRNKVIVDSVGNTRKEVDASSNTINVVKERLDRKTVTYRGINQYMINRNNVERDNMVNLLYSFGLPITDRDKTLFNSVGERSGGYSDTALKTLNNKKNLVLSINNDEFGEIIDGKSIRLELRTLLDVFEIYGTYQKTKKPKEAQDGKINEDTPKSQSIGNNIVFLFSDKIKRPNGDKGKSWSTGHGKTKPFSVNKKELFNLTDNPGTGQQRDECVGVAYLDKGIIVITHPTIADNYDINHRTAMGAKVTMSSYVTKVSQDITCIVGRGEFIKSTNKTYTDDEIRVSELGLYDKEDKLVALAKPNQHLKIGNNEFLAIGVKISV